MADGQLCLMCDICGAEYRGKPSIDHPQRGYNVMQRNALVEDARAIGWTGPLTHESSVDRCPVCSKLEIKQ